MSADHTPAHISLVAGGLAGLTVDLALFPLDTLKTRMQHAKGFQAAGGFRGIYSGIQSVAIGSAPGSALFFMTYEQLSPFFRQKLGNAGQTAIPNTPYTMTTSSVTAHVLAAICAEFMACLIRVPTDHVKMRMQSGEDKSFRAALHAARSLGLLRLYNGFPITLIREIPFGGIQFPLYEHFKSAVFSKRFQRLYAQHPQLSYEELVSQATLSPLLCSILGACAGCFAAFITTPLDVVRTRIMLGTDRNGHSYSPNPFKTLGRVWNESVTDAAAMALPAGTTPPPVGLPPVASLAQSKMYWRSGLNALWKGVAPRTTWISIGGCLFFGAFESFKSICLSLDNNLNPKSTKMGGSYQFKQ